MYKKYIVIVDGLTVGIVDLLPCEVLALASDGNIILKGVNDNV